MNNQQIIINMSETKYLYGATVRSIQDFIYQTNKLREIVGASELVEEICTSKFMELFKQVNVVFNDQNCILQAAGNFRYIFEDKGDCEKIVREFYKSIVGFAPGISAAQAVVEYDGQDFKSAVIELGKRLHTQFNRPPRSATLGLMGIERSRQTGSPVTFVKKENRFGTIEEIHADEGTRAKLYEDPSGKRLKTTKTLCVKAFGEDLDLKDNDDRIAYNIEDITKDNDWIAIIHADGNGLGQVVEKVGYDPMRFKKYSEQLNKATIESARAAYKAVIGQFNNSVKKPNFIPIRPIVLGGDDLTVVCRADLALNYVSAFLSEFEENTRKMLIDDDGESLLKDVFENETDKRLTACAGIAYIKSSFPFYYGYNLAETLCSQAKRDAKDKQEIKDGKKLPMSCLMFHKVQDSFTEDWDAIVKRELTPQPNISFLYGPYYLEGKPDRMTVATLKKYAEELEGKEGNAVKSHLRQWMSMLHDDPNMAQQKLLRLLSMTTMTDFVEAVTKKTGRTFGNKSLDVYPVYDILTIHTINNLKTKED